MAQKSAFVQNAKYLEKLKTSGSVTESVLKNGKYILTCQNANVVLLTENSLVWKDYDGLPKSTDGGMPLTVVLDAVTESPSDVTCLFVVDLDLSSSEMTEIEQRYQGTFVNSRPALFVLNEKESYYVAQARGLVNFSRTVKFCSDCGGKVLPKSTGCHKQCESCQKTHYPAISPVEITLIENEAQTAVLLVRQSRHPRGMFSCVAGFVEAGESLEHNVRREIAEEVGLEVSNIRYVTSQHWAMPSSQLMLGCIATATSDAFELDPVEIQAAQWVPAQQLRDAVDRIHRIKDMRQLDEKLLWVPPPSAVAHQLMATWLRERQTMAVPSHM